nr:F-box/FBD/LRR-repeat protein At1g13570-like [Ipomoea batatas]
MATSPRSNTELYSSKGDLVSELPADVKERILELLSTRVAARTALLSTHWNHVWLRHGRLVFDTNFFQCVSSKGKAEKVIALVNIINNILLLRDEPIKKFTLHMNETDLKPQQSDLDRWCRFYQEMDPKAMNRRVRKSNMPLHIKEEELLQQFLSINIHLLAH